MKYLLCAVECKKDFDYIKLFDLIVTQNSDVIKKINITETDNKAIMDFNKLNITYIGD